MPEYQPSPQMQQTAAAIVQAIQQTKASVANASVTDVKNILEKQILPLIEGQVQLTAVVQADLAAFIQEAAGSSGDDVLTGLVPEDGDALIDLIEEAQSVLKALVDLPQDLKANDLKSRIGELKKKAATAHDDLQQAIDSIEELKLVADPGDDEDESEDEEETQAQDDDDFFGDAA